MFGFGKVIKNSRHDRANGVFFSFFCLICKKNVYNSFYFFAH